MHFYVGVFPDSKAGRIARHTDATPGETGSVLTVEFELSGTPFIGLNGGPEFSFSEAVSFTWYCDTQAAIDSYWAKLSEGGVTGQCGWLKDRFRSEEHTSELQSLMRISYDVFCLHKKNSIIAKPQPLQ